MKNFLPTIGIVAMGAIMYSCGYQTLADAEYLPQQVYMPAANDIYVVDDITPDHGPARYEIDMDARRLRIPLGIYRSGITDDGTVMATLELDPDSVRSLIDNGDMDDEAGVSPEVFPDEMVEIPQVVEVPDGFDVGAFELSVDLDFLMAHPKTRYVAGIRLREADCDIVGKLSYMIVEVNTRFIVPSVLFTCRVSNDTEYIVEFSNTSEYGSDYVWDFGDGSSFVGADPGSHKYPSNGIYDIALSARGITGDIFRQIYTLKLWENITPRYISNYGPFKRKDSGGKTGTLADWQYTGNVIGSNGKGGFYLENGGVMDFYNSAKDLNDAKIYQTFTLPAGSYRAAFTPYLFRGVNRCCYIVSEGSELPDIGCVAEDNAVLGYFEWSEDIGRDTEGFEFTLDSETCVTLGFVVSNTAKSRVQISNVSLYR